VKDPRFGVRSGGFAWRAQHGFRRDRRHLGPTRRLRLSRDGAGERPWPERRGRERLQGSCSSQSGDPGARCTTRRSARTALLMHGARVLPRGLRPSAFSSVHSGERDETRGGSQDEDRTLARANPRVARKNQQKSASEAEVQEARSRLATGACTGTRPRGGPKGLRRGAKASRLSGARWQAPPRIEEKVRAGRSERASRGEGSCWMESVSARPPAAIVHAVATAASSAPSKVRRPRERGAMRMREGDWDARGTAARSGVRSTEAGRLSVKQRLPGASTPGDERGAGSRT